MKTVKKAWVADAVFRVQLAWPQMSAIVNPSGNGSSGSMVYFAVPVIQAYPLIVGITAG